jgi:hypothetical protein
MRQQNAAEQRARGGARESSNSDSEAPDPIPVNRANPAEIRTDGAGTMYEGEQGSLVIEIIDPGQRSAPPATSLELMGVEDAGGGSSLLDWEAGLDGPSLGSRQVGFDLPGRRTSLF